MISIASYDMSERSLYLCIMDSQKRKHLGIFTSSSIGGFYFLLLVWWRIGRGWRRGLRRRFFKCLVCLLFRFPIIHLVVDEVMKCDDRTNHGRQVNNKHHVVAFDCERARQLFNVQIWGKVEDILQLTENVLIEREFSGADSFQVSMHLLKVWYHTLQGIQLGMELMRQGAGGGVFYISKKMFNTNLLCFQSADFTGYMLER